jgi:hypothetical protein
MERKPAKELLRIGGWLLRGEQIAARGKADCLADGLLQEAGDSLMIKLGTVPPGSRWSVSPAGGCHEMKRWMASLALSWNDGLARPGRKSV